MYPIAKKPFTATIRKRGNSYYVSYHYRDENGKRRQKSITCYSHEEAAMRKAEIERDFSQNILIPPAQTTFGEVFEQYMQFYGEVRYKPSTYRNVDQLIRNNVLPEIGRIPIQDITPLDLEKLMKKIRGKTTYEGAKRSGDGGPLSSSTIVSIHSALSMVFKKAIEWKYLMESPLLCQRPIVRNKKMSIWAPEDVGKILTQIRKEGPELLELCIHISYICSARKGEVAALTRSDIDFEQNTVTINKQLLRLDRAAYEKTKSINPAITEYPYNINSKSLLAAVPLKGKNEERILLVPGSFMERLKERKAEFERYKDLYMQTGEFHDYNLVVCHPDGNPIDPRRMNAWLTKYLSDHPELPPIVFHGVRHSSASYKVKLSHGDYKSVQAQMGHAQSNTLMDRYAHAIPQLQQQLVDEIEKDFYNSAVPAKELEEKILALSKENPKLFEELKRLFLQMKDTD